LQSMKNFEDELKPLGFFRIHKSYIISIRHIQTISKKTVCIDEKELPIGETFKDPFNEYMQTNFKQF
jgi:DNA-binding LytR/AlgR family response regulator